MASIYDIARKTGYSIATISRYINGSGYVSEKAAKIIAKAIEEEDYNPNLNARSLVTKKSRTIGVILNGLNNPTTGALLPGIEAAAKEYGYTVIYYNSDENPEQEQVAIRSLLHRQVDGAAIIPTTSEAGNYRLLMDSLPVVSMIRTVRSPAMPSVLVRDYEASYGLAEALLKNGHRRIGFIQGLMRVSTGQDRWRGIVDAMKAYGLEPDPELVIEGFYNGDDSYLAAKRILESGKQVTAIMGGNHITGVGMLKAVNEKRLRIPEDISLVTFDGLNGSYMENFVDFNISSYFYPTREIAEKATGMLIEMVEGRDPFAGYSDRMVFVESSFIDRHTIKKLDN